MNDHLRKKIYDDNGILIKENDIVEVSKLAAGKKPILLKAKYDEKTQQWLFYTGDIVPSTLEELKKLYHVKSIIIINNEKSEKV